jgi:uncharacterized membrane protein (Fun14 family)
VVTLSTDTRGAQEFSSFIAGYGVGGILGGLLLGWASRVIDEVRLFSLSLLITAEIAKR